MREGLSFRLDNWNKGAYDAGINEDTIGEEQNGSDQCGQEA